MEFEIRNTLEEVYELETSILKEVEKAGFDENSAFAIRLALDEALVNAYKHGNGEDPGKRLFIRYEHQGERIIIEVEDEGDGFDQRILSDPRHGDQLQSTSGRGIFLIRQFMTATEFDKGGRCIRFSYDKRDTVGNAIRGLPHWQCDAADILELDPITIHRCPTSVLESVIDLLERGAKNIVIDMKFLETIESAVLGFLVGATREAESRGASLVQVRPQPEVDRIIRATSLDVVLKVYADLRLGIEKSKEVAS